MKTTQTYTISGMTCNNCRASVEDKLSSIPEVNEAKVNLESGEATITMNKHLSAESIQAILPTKYSVSAKSKAIEISPQPKTTEETKNKWQQLKPLFLILFYISTASILLHYNNWSSQSMMLDFMGLFFLVFSFFKLLDLKGFANSFRMYDPLAKILPGYASIYPFLETVLAIMFLMRINIEIALIVSIIILVITTTGVTKAILSKKSIRCACLGTALNLPMTEATFIENVIMLVMAGILLVQII